MPGPNEQRLARLFEEAAAAHHDAFRDVGGTDPDWAAWYAHHLASPLAAVLGHAPDPDVLAADLTRADAEHKRAAEGTAWPVYYARWFLRERWPNLGA